MNTGRHTVEKENQKYRVGFDNLRMKGEQVRGRIYCDIKDTDTSVLEDVDVKISKQNIKQFLNNVKEVEGCVDSDLKDEMYAELFKRKKDAREAALTNASDAKAQDEREQLDVGKTEVNQVLDRSYLLTLIEDTDEVHVGDHVLKAVAAISALSKNLTDMPINLWSIGESGAGKTHCFKTIFRTLPAEHKIKFNTCSPKALYYFTKEKDEDCLEGRVVLFNEAEASEGAVEVLRSITDPDEEEQVLSSVEDQQYLELTISGSPITWFTSVDPLEDGELQNRFMFSNPEAGSNHKQAIAEHQRKNFRRGELQPIKKISFQNLKAAYRQIIDDAKDLDVVIPFDWEWNRQDNPRLQQYFVNMLMTIAKSHYKQRPIIEDTVIATLDDYYTAKLLWDQIESVTRDRIKQRDLQLMEEIPEKQPEHDDDEIPFDEYVTRSDLQEATGRNYSKVRQATKRLMEAGLIRGAKNDSNVWHYWTPQNKKGVANVAISLKTKSLADKSIKNFLNSELGVVIENRFSEGVGSLVTHLTPSYIRDLITTIEIDSKEIKSVFERSELDKIEIPKATTGNNRNKANSTDKENEQSADNEESDVAGKIEKIADDNQQKDALDQARELVGEDTAPGELKEYAQILSDQFGLNSVVVESMLRESPSQVGGE